MKKLVLLFAVVALALVAPAATAVPVTAGHCGGAAVMYSDDTSDSYTFKACTSLGVRAAVQRSTAVTNIMWKISTPRGSATCNWGSTGEAVCSATNSASGRWAPALAGDTVTITTSVSGCTNCIVSVETPERPDA